MPPREEANKVARMGVDAISKIEDLPTNIEQITEDYPGYREQLLKMIPKGGPMGKLDPEKIVLAQALKDQVIASKTLEASKKWGRGIVITGYAHVELKGSASTRFSKLSEKSVKVLTTRDMGKEKALSVIKENIDYIEANYLGYKKV